MCGIAASFSKSSNSNERIVLSLLSQLQHRGNLSFEFYTDHNFSIGANRLAINDELFGFQPSHNEDKTVFSVLNGEIYNSSELKIELAQRGHSFYSDCDTELLVHMWEEYGPKLIYMLDGMFAFIIYDKSNNKIFAARDPLGIKPLYYTDNGNTLLFASEIKAFANLKITALREFPVGRYLFKDKFYEYFSLNRKRLNSGLIDLQELRKLLTESVKKRVNTDLPICVFFSGGIDSTILLNTARKFHDNVTAITVGMKDSPDLKYAKAYCQEHGISQIVKEISYNELYTQFDRTLYYLESFEPNLARGGIFTYFMSLVAKENGFKIALSGEGSDEIFGGYKDFLQLRQSFIPDHCYNLVKDLHKSQLHRLDRCSMANTIEVRVPYLDISLVEYALSVHPGFKVYNSTSLINKYLLRKAFEDILPEEIFLRDKTPMDEGAIWGGRSELDELMMSILSDLSLARRLITNNTFVTNNEEEKYYFARYNSFGYTYYENFKRIQVRSF